MKKTVCAILLAAGSSSRMGCDADGKPVNKLLAEICGSNPIERCVKAFSGHVDEMVITVSVNTREAAERASALTDVPVTITYGGAMRQDSVLNGIRATSCDIVAIHDCARCLVSDAVIEEAIASAFEYGSGVAAIKARDTLRRADTGETVDRSGLLVMQTPQCFDRIKLLDAYELLDSEATDDAAVWQKAYGAPRFTGGSIANQKLTEPGDIEFFTSIAAKENCFMRIGMGEDTHRLTEGRKLIIGGVDIPYRMGLLGHSDADVLVHAIIDAMLGAAALGDIGRHFPDSDPKYKGISSMILLERAAELVECSGYRVVNIDATITAQEPKLAPYIDEMRKRIADAIPRIGIKEVSVKATTPEHTGPEGNLECITARAVACISAL
ncbi:MAG: 2-C-methyl-D-erythritol 2,4-cyclodiphosphate synthase [Clostridia bacterium]|nr:2-C-methyl-D-erythritol 2,4-cyclodiphosphate synthase [Clostridia bacterium]